MELVTPGHPGAEVWVPLPYGLLPDGKRVYMGNPGQSFGIRVSRKSLAVKPAFVKVFIDGQRLPYDHRMGSCVLSYVFKGYDVDAAFTEYRPFVFVRPEHPEGVHSVKQEQPPPSALGTIACHLYAFEYVNEPPRMAAALPSRMSLPPPFGPLPPPPPPPQATPESCASSDGTKFWQRPGLATRAATTAVLRNASEKCTGKEVVQELLRVLKVSYDCREHLELRGVSLLPIPAAAVLVSSSASSTGVKDEAPQVPTTPSSEEQPVAAEDTPDETAQIRKKARTTTAPADA